MKRGCMPAKRFLMSLDFGTGSGRCFLTAVDGSEHYWSQKEWSFDTPPEAQPGGFNFRPDLFWHTLGQTVRDAMKRANITPSQVAAVSATSLREGFVLLDDGGKELFAVPNRDARAWKEAKVVSERLGQRMNDVSGHWPSAGMAPARFLWLRHHRPDILERARVLLMVNDWILYRLCGEYACEPTNAAETCFYDIVEHRWDHSLLEACEVPTDLFPPAARAGYVLGRVTPTAAEMTGLVSGTPVVVAGADTQCALLGAGAVEAGELAVVAGTTTPVQMVLDKPAIDPQGRTWSGPHVVPRRWEVESNCGLSGTLLRWFLDSFCQGEKTVARNLGVDAYSLLEREAQNSPVGSNDVSAVIGPRLMNAKGRMVSAPYLAGFVLPADAHTVITEVDSKRHFIRAIFEAHAFAVRANSQQIVEVSGHEIKRASVCGGASKSEFWMQMVANVLGMTVDRPTVSEASGLGAAMCAGIGIGEYEDFTEGVKTLVKIHERFEPQEEYRGAYESAYERWLVLQRVQDPTR